MWHTSLLAPLPRGEVFVHHARHLTLLPLPFWAFQFWNCRVFLDLGHAFLKPIHFQLKDYLSMWPTWHLPAQSHTGPHTDGCADSVCARLFPLRRNLCLHVLQEMTWDSAKALGSTLKPPSIMYGSLRWRTKATNLLHSCAFVCLGYLRHTWHTCLSGWCCISIWQAIQPQPSMTNMSFKWMCWCPGKTSMIPPFVPPLSDACASTAIVFHPLVLRNCSLLSKAPWWRCVSTKKRGLCGWWKSHDPLASRSWWHSAWQTPFWTGLLFLVTGWLSSSSASSFWGHVLAPLVPAKSGLSRKVASATWVYLRKHIVPTFSLDFPAFSLGFPTFSLGFPTFSLAIELIKLIVCKCSSCVMLMLSVDCCCDGRCRSSSSSSSSSVSSP